MGFLGSALSTLGGGLLPGSVAAGYTAARAAESAANTQAQAAQKAIDEQRRQFDAIQALMKPYVQAGTGALGQQQALLGLGGAGAQEQAIAGLSGSPQMQSMLQQGENALLQNAAATGGLRGGNTQAALAQFRPQLLSALIEQQYGRLGGLSGLGQASAAGQAAAGQNMASNVGNLLGQQGAAVAGGQLGQAAAANNLLSNLTGIGAMGGRAMGIF